MKIKTKYHGEIDLDLYKEHCTKSIYKILPLMEEKKEWRRFLKGFLVELSGIDSLVSDLNYISLMGKLEGLLQMEIEPCMPKEKEIFRKIIFDSIELAKEINSFEQEG